MDRINNWKLADELNVFQIALLIAEYDPGEFENDGYDRWPKEVRSHIAPYLHAIKNAARREKFEFYAVRDDYDIDWYNSLVNIESFCTWLKSRNFVDGFFVANRDDVDRLSDKDGEFYAPKLAAAVRAWNEVTSQPELTNGKTPKKALEIWLRKHANEYGLTGKDGNPNTLGIEEICKVANWKPSGGASPTPTAITSSPQLDPLGGRRVRPRPPATDKESSFGRSSPPTPRLSDSLDDDIPF